MGNVGSQPASGSGTADPAQRGAVVPPNASTSSDLISPAPPPRTELAALAPAVLRARLAALVDARIVRQCIEKRELVDLLHRSLGGGDDTCAICYCEQVAAWRMPCCARPDSDLKYCRRCLEIVARDYCPADLSLGICPTCRGYFRLRRGPADGRGRVLLGSADPAEIARSLLVVEEAEPPLNPCRMCTQLRVLPPGTNGLCAKCDIGQRVCLRYECERCGRTQSIPHPMFDYQPSPREFGSATWACHQRCGDYTHWRILETDLGKIPVVYRPAAWGPEAWLEAVGERSRASGA